MKIEQTRWRPETGWEPDEPGQMKADPQVVLVFGSRKTVQSRELLDRVCSAYPRAYVCGCSTAGEIFDTQVADDTLVVTAIHFEHTEVQASFESIDDPENSLEVGSRLARSISSEGLRHAFVLSDGLGVNGSELVRGLKNGVPDNVTITGGLSGDGERFEETLVIWGGKPLSGIVGILGFYGDRLSVGYGSMGGWDPFGPERLITRSTNNVLYELDEQSALSLYKTYLGKHAGGLPATGLLFPLSLRTRDTDRGVVRTLLGVDEKDQSMTFAGDVPEGSYVRLMKANFDRLVEGAVGAARTSQDVLDSSNPELAILISCVGRKLVLKQRIEEEVEGVREVVGCGATIAGFYSYGEISPFTANAECELHNQTMTITSFRER